MPTPQDDISPLYERWFPHLSQEEKVRFTVELRQFLGALYRVYVRLEEQGLLDDDSEESETHGTLESDNAPAP